MVGNHEGHEGHEEACVGYRQNSILTIAFHSFVLFVSFVVTWHPSLWESSD
jgi:hypothetical protein